MTIIEPPAPPTFRHGGVRQTEIETERDVEEIELDEDLPELELPEPEENVCHISEQDKQFCERPFRSGDNLIDVRQNPLVLTASRCKCSLQRCPDCLDIWLGYKP